MKNNLAVIILNYNDPTNTIRYVNEIKKYKCIDRIIVVDNKSPDGSYEKLRKLSVDNIDVIETDGNKGYAYGNNYAIRYLNDKYGEHNYIVISNPDVEVSEDAYNKCLEFLDNNSDVAICAPRMYDINDKPHQLSGWKLRNLHNDIMDSSPALTALVNRPHLERYTAKYLSKDIAYVDCCAGSFFMIRHEAFKKVNYFDENTFLYFEEDILGNKLKKSGYKNVVLNTCKFKHYESVTVDQNMTSYRKFKNLQKSKRYYHTHYNDKCNKWYNKWKIIRLDFVTLFRPIEDKIHLSKLTAKLCPIISKGIVTLFLKFLILLIQILLLPVSYISRKLRRKEKVLYFSLVTWKWIKQRPHFVAMELVNTGKYKVDYRYQALYDRFTPDHEKKNLVKNKVEKIKNFRILPFKIFPAVTRFRIFLNSNIAFFRTSFWNYDTIILTHPNQIDFFFMKVHKLKKTKFIYEAMDNYEEWEEDKDGYLDKQRRLIQNSKHLIVSSDKLRTKFIEMYGLKDDYITLVRNGYDRRTFEAYEKINTNLKHPSITYIGTVDDWFDFDSINEYAKKHKDIYFNIIGPMNPAVKEIAKNIEADNVIFHGPIEHHLVPKYIEDSEIMMMPFLINDIIEYVDPVKLYEYLYMKKPVVSSYWKELDQFDGLVYFYHEKEEFEDVINKALNTKFKENDKYKKLINDSTWENRLEEYFKVLDK